MRDHVWLARVRLSVRFNADTLGNSRPTLPTLPTLEIIFAVEKAIPTAFSHLPPFSASRWCTHWPWGSPAQGLAAKTTAPALGARGCVVGVCCEHATAHAPSSPGMIDTGASQRRWLRASCGPQHALAALVRRCLVKAMAIQLASVPGLRWRRGFFLSLLLGHLGSARGQVEGGRETQGAKGGGG